MVETFPYRRTAQTFCLSVGLPTEIPTFQISIVLFFQSVWQEDHPTKTKMSWNDVYISHFCQVVSSAKHSSMGVPFLRRGNPYCNSPTSQTWRKQIPGGWRCPSPMGSDRKPPWDDVWSRGSSEVWWCCGVFYPQQLEEQPWIIHMHLNTICQYASFRSEMIRTKAAIYTPHRRKLFSRFFPVIHQSHGQSQALEVWNEKNSTYSVCLHVFSNFGRHYSLLCTLCLFLVHPKGFMLNGAPDRDLWEHVSLRLWCYICYSLPIQS